MKEERNLDYIPPARNEYPDYRIDPDKETIESMGQYTGIYVDEPLMPFPKADFNKIKSVHQIDIRTLSDIRDDLIKHLEEISDSDPQAYEFTLNELERIKEILKTRENQLEN